MMRTDRNADAARERVLPARCAVSFGAAALAGALAVGCGAARGPVPAAGEDRPRDVVAERTERQTAPSDRPAPVVTEAGTPDRPEASGSGGVVHVVARGETLWRISQRYGLSVRAIARANGIADVSKIEAGRVLHIPIRAVGPWFAWPVAGREVLSEFGNPRRSHRHAGLDIRARAGDPVLAAESGRIAYAGSTMRGYGKTLVIDHGNGVETLYAHNSALLVRVGQRVRRGETIARAGRTGNATTDHCHFEVRIDDVPVDPMPYLSGAIAASRPTAP